MRKIFLVTTTEKQMELDYHSKTNRIREMLCAQDIFSDNHSQRNRIGELLCAQDIFSDNYSKINRIRVML